jgi:molybdenum cofactor cytidylyltransferase
MSARRNGHVAGVVLAAGSSSRMGRNKLLLDLGGESVLRRAARAAAAGCDLVVVVLGHEADRAQSELAGLACRCVRNADHALGAGTSIRAGVAAVPPGTQAIVFTLADMPFATAATIRAAVEAYRAGTARVVISRYGETEAPPTLFDRSLFDELLAVDPKRGARVVARRHQGDAAEVVWPAADGLDLDAPADYEAARARLAQGQRGGAKSG